MTAYCFFDVREVRDPEMLEQYKQGVLATVKAFGGQYVLMSGRCDGVEGSWRPVTPVMIRFPNLERAHEWYDSDVYAELKLLRLAATEGDAVFMESEPSEFISE